MPDWIASAKSGRDKLNSYHEMYQQKRARGEPLLSRRKDELDERVPSRPSHVRPLSEMRDPHAWAPPPRSYRGPDDKIVPMAPSSTHAQTHAQPSVPSASSLPLHGAPTSSKHGSHKPSLPPRLQYPEPQAPHGTSGTPSGSNAPFTSRDYSRAPMPPPRDAPIVPPHGAPKQPPRPGVASPALSPHSGPAALDYESARPPPLPTRGSPSVSAPASVHLPQVTAAQTVPPNMASAAESLPIASPDEPPPAYSALASENPGNQ